MMLVLLSCPGSYYPLAAITMLWTAVALAQSPLPSSHELEIVVVDASHVAVADATVELHDAKGPMHSATTSAEGRVVFENLPEAHLLVSVSKDGFQPVKKFNYPGLFSA